MNRYNRLINAKRERERWKSIFREELVRLFSYLMVVGSSENSHHIGLDS